MKSFSDVAAIVRAQQRRWAEARGLAFNTRSWLRDPEDNIFGGLSPEVRAALAAGRGGELGSADIPGKLSAPHSSAALAINVFQTWRRTDVAPLAKALSVPTGFSLAFEGQHATGNRGAMANLDVELGWKGVERVIGIESKFLETLAPHAPLLSSYISNRALAAFWAEHPRLHALAKAATRSDCGGYQRVDVAQLIKHCLALKKATPRASLMLLWFDFSAVSSRGEQASRDVQREADMFTEAVGDEIEFSAMTYQRLVGSLESSAAVDVEWVSYVRERYFAAASVS